MDVRGERIAAGHYGHDGDDRAAGRNGRQSSW